MKKRVNIILLIFLLVSFLAFLNPTFPPFKIVRGFAQAIFSVPKLALYTVKLGFLSEGKEVSQLKDENRKLYEKLSDFDRLKRDNEALRSQFEISSAASQNLLLAKVIGFLGPLSNPTSLIIDKGEIDGVKNGQAVVSGKNLVGKIENISEKFSQVMLPVNKNFTVLGKSSNNNSQGIVRGENDFILFDQIVITEKVEDQEVVLTKGEDNGIQSDLIVGKISSVNRRESAPFQTAKIESLVPFSKLETVFIEK